MEQTVEEAIRFFDGLWQNTQKNRKNRKKELKKTGIAPIV